MIANPGAIVLTTFNAKYAHCSFGLRYLAANLGELRPCSLIREFEISARAFDAVEDVLRHGPKVVGLGVYIWNVRISTEFASLLKKIMPGITLVLGGPEVSYEVEEQEICRYADYVVCGEGELAFREICEKVINGERPEKKIYRAPAIDLEQLQLPYELYDNVDVATRIIYVEASRGCPFTCDFCLSSLDERVRSFSEEQFLTEMERLLQRGVRHFKFVDRTFNLSPRVSSAILDFFWERQSEDLFLHFEMVPDRFPKELKERVERFSPGTLQFEVGVQTFNEEVAARIRRRQKNEKIEENLDWLAKTKVHVHADLIVGLPGENLESFAQGFDRLYNLGVDEIQVGILKRLRGAPIARHDEEFQMKYSEHAPYEVLSTSALSFQELQEMRRFARYWDIVVNSGKLLHTAELICERGSPFLEFLSFTRWLYANLGVTHGIALERLERMLEEYLQNQKTLPAERIMRALDQDRKRRDKAKGGFNKRQLRHIK